MRPYRKEKIASVIRQVVSEAIAYKLHDPRVDLATTVTRVEMAADLLIAKVFLTVAGGEAIERRTLQGVVSAGGFLQRQVARELQIRHCPTLRFEIDRQEKGARRTLSALAENLRQDPTLGDAVDDSQAVAAEQDVESREELDSGVPDQPQDMDP